MQARRYRSALQACTALAVLSLSTEALAQEAATGAAPTGEATTLQPVVVKGKRVRPSLVSDTPLASRTEAETIRKKEITDVKDLGKTTELGVEYVESRAGAAGGMYLRGMGGPRIATLIDDIPIPYLETLTRNGSQSPTTDISDSSNSFDFASLSAVDVVRGADSSRVGGAMAGVLSMRTLEPDDIIPEGRDWGVVTKTGYDSADRSGSGSIAAARRLGDTSVLFQGSLKRGDELNNRGSNDVIGSLRTKPNPTDTKQNSLLLKVRQDVEGGHRIGLTAERFVRDYDIDLKSLQNGTTLRPGYYWGFEDTQRERVSFDYDYVAPETGGLIDAAKLTLYWQRLIKDSGSNATRFENGTSSARSWVYDRENETRESSFGLTGGTVSEFETDTLSHSVRIGGNLDVFQYEQFVTAIGGASFGTSTTSSSQADVPNVDGTRFGLFVEDAITFGDSGFTLTPGLRFDWHRYEPQKNAGFDANTGIGRFGFPDAHDGARLSPKLLASYQATSDLKLFAQWSMTNRAPTVTELYSNYTNIAGGYTVLGNTVLKSETGNGFEVGADYEADSLKAKLTLFHNRYRNYIDSVAYFTNDYPAGYYPTAGFLYNTWRNRANVHISGVELSGRKEFANGFFAHGSLVYNYGKDADTGEFLRTVAPVKSILGVGYEQEDWGVDLSTILSARMREDGTQYELPGTAYQTSYETFDAPGYGIVNLTGWWEPEQTEGLRIQAGFYNVFNKKYWNAVGVRDIRTSGSGASGGTNLPIDAYTEAGRSFKISITKKF